MRNLIGEGGLLSVGTPLPKGVSIDRVLEACALKAGWQNSQAGWKKLEPEQAVSSSLRRGLGIACGFKNVGFSFGAPEQCSAMYNDALAGQWQGALYGQVAVRVGPLARGAGFRFGHQDLAAVLAHKIAARTPNPAGSAVQSFGRMACHDRPRCGDTTCLQARQGLLQLFKRLERHRFIDAGTFQQIAPIENNARIAQPGNRPRLFIANQKSV